MKRYWVFAGANYYPKCGIEDLLLTTDNIHVAMCVARDNVSSQCSGYWGQVFDAHEKEILFFECG